MVRKTDENLRENFDNITKQCGNIPLYPEFEQYTTISMVTYATRLGLKGKVYDKIVQHYVSEQDFHKYK